MKYEKVKLKRIGKIITGSTPKTKNVEYYNSKDYMFIAPADIKNVRYVVKAEKHISKLAFIDYYNRFIKAESIMVDCIGSDMGNVAITTNICLTNQQINSISDIEPTKYNYKFIYYSLSTMKKYFHQIGQNGSTMPIINKTMFENIEIKVPQKLIQDKIVKIVSYIDDKIDLNNQINDNL